METCGYDNMKIDESCEGERDNVKSSWKPFWRQLFVSSGVWSIYFVLGLGFGAPTVMIPQIRKEANSTEAVTEEMASWLSSVHGYSALPWVFILSIFTRYVGRKIPFLLVCINTLVGFIVFYCSVNATHLLICAIMQGMLLASNMTLLVVIVTEYSSPQYRGVFMIIKSTFFFWGVWIANAVGTFSHWKNIVLIAFFCCIYPFTAIFWPESPYWLAMKGRFDECTNSHHWLKGFDKKSEYELEILINSQREYQKSAADRKKFASENRLKSIIATVTTKAFYMPLLLSVCVMSMYHFSGKLVCSMYSLDVMKQITHSDSAANVGMLIMDSVTILGMQAGCALSKFLKRRTLLLCSTSLGILFLLAISIYLYSIKFIWVNENKIISILLLTSFSVSISCGPMIMPSTIFGELICLRYQTSCLLILTLFSEFLMASMFKVSPYIFRTFSLPGAFLFYGTSASFFAVIVYKYLPETKDRTLFEIENYFKEPTETTDVAVGLIKNNT